MSLYIQKKRKTKFLLWAPNDLLAPRNQVFLNIWEAIYNVETTRFLSSLLLF
jgi:hypothetical protein